MTITDFMVINQFVENNYYQFIFNSLKIPTLSKTVIYNKNK